MSDKVKLIKEEIESYKESMKGLEPHSDFRRGQITAYNQILQFIDSLPEEHNEDLNEQVNTWIKIDNEHPLPKFEEVLGYNKEWIEADFNPKGVRIGYLTDEGNFISAKYEPDGEDYISKYEEGDDYQFFQTLEDGTKKTWYNNGDDRGDIEGYRPNLPTHYMKISIDGIKKK